MFHYSLCYYPDPHYKLYKNSVTFTDSCNLCTVQCYITPQEFNQYFVKTFCCYKTIDKKKCINYIYSQSVCPFCRQSFISPDNMPNRLPLTLKYRHEHQIQSIEMDKRYLLYGINTLDFIKRPTLLQNPT